MSLPLDFKLHKNKDPVCVVPVYLNVEVNLLCKVVLDSRNIVMSVNF